MSWLTPVTWKYTLSLYLLGIQSTLNKSPGATPEIPYNERDHALFIAFGPYRDPRYAVSVLVEHGGSGSSTAAPIARKIFDEVHNQGV